MKRSIHHLKIATSDCEIVISITQKDIDENGSVREFIFNRIKSSTVKKIYIKHIEEERWRELCLY